MTASDCRKKRFILLLYPFTRSSNTLKTFHWIKGDNLYHAHLFPSDPHRVCEFVSFPFLSARYLNHALRAPLNEDGSGAEPKFPEHPVNLVRKDRYKS